MRGFLRKSVLQIGNIVAQYHYYLVAFVTSTFLANYVGLENVGYVFAASSAIVALMLYAAPPIFRSFGTRNVITVVGIGEVIALLGLSIVGSAALAVAFFTAHVVFAYTLFIGIDLLIEASICEESKTGATRTLYLTLTNIAVFLASLSLSFIAFDGEYYRVFIASALVLIAFLGYAHLFFPAISFPAREALPGSVISSFRTNKSLRLITGAHLLLQIFFAWMSIYMPILLFSYEGFDWGQIGIIFALAMVPYVVLEFPMGYIADKWLGEKELLTGGFIIIATSLVAMMLLHHAPFWWWVAIMVISRIGSAAVESMTEVHFFRHVTEKDTDIITTFRALRPLGSIVGPLVASVALLVLTLPMSFGVFGLVMVLGIPLSLSIVDSK